MCQYNTLQQLHCQVSIQYIAASLPSVNTIQCSFIAKCQYNTLQLHCQVSIQYIGASLPSVSTIALEMFCGAKHTHYTFTPVIKHHSTGTTANIGVNVTDNKQKKKKKKKNPTAILSYECRIKIFPLRGLPHKNYCP